MNHRGLSTNLRRVGLIAILCAWSGSTATQAQTANWGLTGSDAYYTAGNVGIGTTTPGLKLDVKANASGAAVGRIQNLSSTGYSGFEYLAPNGATALYIGTNNSAPNSRINSVAGYPLVFLTESTERIRVTSGGNVGIGTATPTTKLHVVGDATFTGTVTGGNIQATYQDIAEWVPSSRNLAAGTVVTLDPERSNNVLPSSIPYDTRVAGVVSDKPGLLLGQGGEGKLRIATTGRVNVRVRSDRPVQIGDLLVTSGEEGVAMVSEPVEVGGLRIHRPGTLIGKALEPMKPGTGEILVLLSLQ